MLLIVLAWLCVGLAIPVCAAAAIVCLIFLLVFLSRRRKTEQDSWEYKVLSDRILRTRNWTILLAGAAAACLGLVLLLENLIVFNM